MSELAQRKHRPSLRGSDGAVPARRKVLRRRFLGGMGASGLAAAMTVFGKTPAYAGAGWWQCCYLACGAPTVSMSTCLNANHYVWSCTTSGGFLWCRCCEIYGTKSGCCCGYRASAGQCQYG